MCTTGPLIRADARKCDFSLLTFYSILNLSFPFNKEDLRAVIRKIRKSSPPPLIVDFLKLFSLRIILNARSHFSIIWTLADLGEGVGRVGHAPPPSNYNRGGGREGEAPPPQKKKIIIIIILIKMIRM